MTQKVIQLRFQPTLMAPKIIENVVVAEIYRIPSLGWFYAIELAKTRK